MIVPESLVPAINSLQQNMFINAPTISQTAALRCWDEDTLTELEQHVTKYRTSRTIILQALAKLTDLDPSHIAPADGGFYIYIDLGAANVAPGFGSVTMCKTLLEEEHVAFTPGRKLLCRAIGKATYSVLLTIRSFPPGTSIQVMTSKTRQLILVIEDFGSRMQVASTQQSKRWNVSEGSGRRGWNVCVRRKGQNRKAFL